jgi:hypothetical protein
VPIAQPFILKELKGGMNKMNQRKYWSMNESKIGNANLKAAIKDIRETEESLDYQTIDGIEYFREGVETLVKAAELLYRQRDIIPYRERIVLAQMHDTISRFYDKRASKVAKVAADTNEAYECLEVKSNQEAIDTLSNVSNAFKDKSNEHQDESLKIKESYQK